MMTPIKIFIGFLMGMLYASLIWLFVTQFKVLNIWVLIIAFGILLSLTMLGLAAIGTFLITNWHKR